MPDPAKVADKRILTRESNDWMAAQNPPPPALEHHIDDPALREEAAQLSQEEHRTRINGLRDAFRAKSGKARQDFGTAHDYREPKPRLSRRGERSRGQH